MYELGVKEADCKPHGAMCGDRFFEKRDCACNPFIAPPAAGGRHLIPPLGTVSNGSRTEGAIHAILLGLNLSVDKL
jgi:hypothetical protein